MPFVTWITGLPGSGKSTVAEALKSSLNKDVIILRMDDLRNIVTPNPTYSEEEREILYRSLVYSATKLYERGSTVIIDATGNMRRWRELARELIENFIEVFLKCPIEVCREREMERKDTHKAPRDIYKKAGEGWPVPGVNVPYEEPIDPEITIDIEKTDIDNAVNTILNEIKRRSL